MAIEKEVDFISPDLYSINEIKKIMLIFYIDISDLKAQIKEKREKIEQLRKELEKRGE